MAKQVETYKYKIVVKYIDYIKIFEEESTIEPSTIGFRLNNQCFDFISVGNKHFNKKDIILIEELKGE